MSSKYEISAMFKGGDQVVAEFRRMRAEADKTSKAMQQMGRAQSNPMREAAENHRRMMASMREQGERARGTFDKLEKGFRAYDRLSYSLRDARESLRLYTDEALRLARAQEKFKSINLSPAENEKAFRAVKGTVDSIKGLTLADTTETITDLHTALGNLDHAIDALPVASKFRFSFQTLFGDKFNGQQLEEQIQAAFKYLEVTGAVAKGQAEMEARFNAMAQIQAATGGRVTPSDMLQVARRAGPAAQGLSLQGMRNLATLVPEVGAEGTGTALMSMYQALIGGVMKQSAAAEFVRLGLVDPKKIEFGHGQKIKRLMPGANKLGALMQEDPLKAADALMEAMKKPLHGPAIDTANANKVREELAILFGNRTAQKLMSILTTQRGQVVKEAGIAEGAKNIEQLYKQALDSPMGKMQQFEAAMANFRAEVGLPLVNALTQAATAFKPLISLMGQHPYITLTAIALSKLARVAADFRGSGFFELFKRSASTGGVQPGLMKTGQGWGSLLAKGMGAGLALYGISAIISEFSRRSELEQQSREIGARIGEVMRMGVNEDLSKLPDDVVRQLLKARAATQAVQLGELKAQKIAVGGEESDVIKGLLLALTPSRQDMAPPIRLDEITRSRGGHSFTSIPTDSETRSKVVRQFLTEIMQGLDIKSDVEMGTFLEKSRSALTAAGAEGAYPILEEMARTTYPALMASYEKHIQLNEEVARRLGSTGGQITFFSQEIEAATKRLQTLGAGAVDKDGKPVTLEQKASGGRVLRSGPIWVHRGEDIVPAHATRQYNVQRASSNAVNISMPVNVDARGATDPEAIHQAVATALRSGRAEIEDSVERILNRKFRDRGLMI